MPLEKFDESGTGRGRPEGTDPMISLRKSKSVGVNRTALEEYFDEMDAAVMYYDEEENVVGIEPVEDKDSDEAAYTVSKSDSGGTIAPQAFLERYDLTPEVTTQYTPEWDDDDGMILIDVDNPKRKYGDPDDE